MITRKVALNALAMGFGENFDYFFHLFSRKEMLMEDMICSGKKLGRDLVVDSLKVAGKEPVRELIIITPADVSSKRNNQNMFRFSYRVGNVGFMGARDFENVTYFWDLKDKNNDKVVSRQHGMSLGPNEYKVIEDEIGFNLKDGSLRDGVILVRLDAFSKIAEDNETNNEMSSTIVFKGFQGNTPAEPYLHIDYLRVGKRTPVQGRIRLTKQESRGAKDGRHAFDVEFVLRNFGTKSATDFDNLFLLDGKKFSRQKGVSLQPGESQFVQMPVYFPIHDGKFSVQVDANNKYPKGPGCKQIAEVQISFQGLK